MRKRKKVRNGVRKGESSFKKEGGISFTLCDSLRTEAFVSALTAGCFLSGLVHFSFRIAVTDSGLPRFGKLRAKH